MPTPVDNAKSPTPMRSRVPGILLKSLALAWFLGAAVCLPQAMPNFPVQSLREAIGGALIHIPLAIGAVAVGFGLWRTRRWARTTALLIGWLALPVWVLVIVPSAGMFAALLLFAVPPILVVALLQTYFLTRPATKALFGLPISHS